jgi:2-hydroxy-3-oxopropionate reductase
MTNRPIIGFIGFGIMGTPMAMNLIKCGYALNVYARRPESLIPLRDQNITVCNSPRELAACSDIIISIVSDTPDVREVLMGEQGVIQGVQQNSLVIDMSTIAAEASREMASAFLGRNARLIDAPVSGGEIGAIEGTLSIMVGASRDAFERALPILQCLGKNIVHVGETGAGQIAKACNQIIVAQTMVAVAEAYLLAQKNQVDPARVREALLGGFAYSRILEVHGQRMLNHNYQPGFKARLHNKDLHIALNSASMASVDLPASGIAADYMERLVREGFGELDSSAIAKIVGSG